MFADSEEIIPRFELQWRRFHHVLCKQNTDTLAIWTEITSYRNATREIHLVTSLSLECPHSSADVELIFSHNNIAS